jgi:regulator of Ty1 transposition protein 109
MAASPAPSPSRENTPSLLDDVLTRLSSLPGRRRLTATVLVSQPRKKAAAAVFPYAPKIEDVQAIEQEVLLLIAENKDTQQTQDQPQSDATHPRGPGPGAYVAAIQANLYIFPTTHSVIVYISKVDTTGQGQRPSPTRAATVALLEHIVRRWFARGPSEGSPGWNVWVHLFARAQNQYLFPASIEHPGKRVLSDAGLVKWWKAVMDDFVSSCVKDGKVSGGGGGGGRLRAEPHVILPGATDDEAMHLLKIPLRKPEATTGHDWRYGHPYSTLTVLHLVFTCKVSTSHPMFTPIDFGTHPLLSRRPEITIHCRADGLTHHCFWNDHSTACQATPHR